MLKRGLKSSKDEGKQRKQRKQRQEEQHEMAGGKNERRETKREETEKHYIENEGGKTGMRGRTFRKITKSLRDHTHR